jgi:transposase
LTHSTETTSQAKTTSSLTAEVTSLKAEVSKLSSMLNQAQTLIKCLEENARLAKVRQFGKKTEKTESLQMELFDELLREELPESEEDAEKETIHYERRKPKKKGRLIDTSKLPREKIVYDLTDDEKKCRCGCELTKVGEDCSEQIDYIPASLKVIEHIKLKYSCKQCQSIQAAPKPEQPLGKCMATEGFVTDVIIKKYEHHLPLYRQSKILSQNGAEVPDNTLGNWVMHAADLLAPIGNALWEQISHVSNLQADETPVKILKPDKKGYMWVYHSCQPDNRFVLFEFSLSRGADIPNARLSNYSGLLQTDGFGGYNGLRNKADVINLGCWDHARRKFTDAVKVCNKNDTGVAGKLLRKINKLYAIEREAKSMNFKQRYKLRQKKSVPILDEIHKMFTNTCALPQSLLGKAITYLNNQWQELYEYTKHGEAEFSNCWIENQIRPFAIGKKNWMFVGNEISANKAALLYSLIQSCRMNGINPRLYIIYVLRQASRLRRKEINPTDLLPQGNRI